MLGMHNRWELLLNKPNPFTLTRDNTMATTTSQDQDQSPQKIRWTKEEKVVLELVELMQHGVQPWKKEWGGTATFRNLITGHEYQGANPAVLAHVHAGQGVHLASLLNGAGQAKKAGFSFRKGTYKACYILRALNSAQQKPRTRTGK